MTRRPPADEIPVFGPAFIAKVKTVMRRLGVNRYNCWVLRADDSLALIRFNRNGSRRILEVIPPAR